MDEDTHICGRCRQEFHNLDDYVAHKRGGCSQKDSGILQMQPHKQEMDGPGITVLPTATSMS